MVTRLTCVIENTSARPDLTAEAGFSVLVERHGAAVLFDTGLSGAAAANALLLGIDLSSIRTVALSHGHVDHTGGLSAFLAGASPEVAVHCHPAALLPRYTIYPGKPPSESGLKPIAGLEERLQISAAPVHLAPGVLLSGEIPRVTSFEDTGGPFFLDPAGAVKDPLSDDLSLIIESRDGPIVLTGCAHAGVINVLLRAAELTGGRSFAAVLGGMHLGSASPERLRRTVEALRGFDIRRIGPVHCTGRDAAHAIGELFGDRCFAFPAGTIIEF